MKLPTAAPPLANVEPVLQLENVTLARGGHAILKGVSLEVFVGGIVTLIGPNGAGKTTLVRVALGLIEPDSGVIRRQAGVRVGYMPQKIAIDASLPLTVKRFLGLGGWRLGKRIPAILEEVGVPHLANSDMASLSGGEMQRVLMARALLRDPTLLILDEPDQGLDIAGQAHLYDLIAEVREKRGCAVLMISHDLHMVMAATDHVICLNQHVCCAGHPETVRTDPSFVEMFGDQVAHSLAVYHHDHDHDHDVTGNVVPPEDHHHHG
ncbi:MAG: zinc ABC transporter ATP-binding protein ZnuC [Magnetospiraceae bacterium]